MTLQNLRVFGLDDQDFMTVLGWIMNANLRRGCQATCTPPPVPASDAIKVSSACACKLVQAWTPPWTRWLQHTHSQTRLIGLILMASLAGGVQVAWQQLPPSQLVQGRMQGCNTGLPAAQVWSDSTAVSCMCLWAPRLSTPADQQASLHLLCVVHMHWSSAD